MYPFLHRKNTCDQILNNLYVWYKVNGNDQINYFCLANANLKMQILVYRNCVLC